MICKVIATSFNERKVRLSTIYPDHQQNISSPEEALQMLKDIIKFEENNDPGEKTDIIIVNSETGFREGNLFIEEINGRKLKRGKIIAYTRGNIGWSFGSYDDAFQRFRNDYKYWIFTEDDILIGGKDYAKKLRQRWEEIEGINIDIGFLALVRVIRHQYGIHCGGGVGFTSRCVLDKVIDKYGMLPHHKKTYDITKSPEANKNDIIINGEVPFTNKIDELGFYLFNYGKNNSWNLQENLCIPYFMEKENIYE